MFFKVCIEYNFIIYYQGNKRRVVNILSTNWCWQNYADGYRFLIDDLSSICNWSNTTGATSGLGTIYHFEPPGITSGFLWGSCYSILSFMCSVLQIVTCPFVLFFWLLRCLSFFDLRILITPLVSSNSSYVEVKGTTNGASNYPRIPLIRV